MKDQETIAQVIHGVSREAGEIRFSVATRHLPGDEYFEEVLDWQV